MTNKLTGFATILMVAVLTFTAPVLAQDAPEGVPMGEVQYGDPNAGQGYYGSGSDTSAYGDLDAAAVDNPYATGEGSTEWQSNTFDGTNASGSYQDTGTLDPSYGNGAYSNSDE